MAAALVLTGLALVGVVGGAAFHRSLSALWASLGGLILIVVAFIWIVPEIAEEWGWPGALLAVAAAAALLGAADWTLVRFGRSPRHGVLAPLVVAAAIHSLLDGWSVRALGNERVPLALAPIGLSLHKLPEGFALGWALRRSIESRTEAVALGVAAELFTLVGAALEPSANRIGIDRFGGYWTPTVLSLIAGAFVFLALHAIVPRLARHEHHL